MDSVIKVDNLSKKFRLYKNPWHRAVEWATFGRRRYHQEFWALRNISFEVSRGECLGIIGPNGAGKSTLLKILSRSLYPTSGRFEIRGRMLSLLELGTGFNPELTGRQNLYNSAHLLGLPAEYLEARLGDIAQFAGLGEFLDRPLKVYSSGMYVRLAFSLFVFLEPEALVIDEALSVGDVFFQQKSFAKLREIISRGTTCLFVSHDTAAVQNLCQEAIFLQQGQIAFYGDALEAVSRYLGSMGTQPRDKAVVERGRMQPGSSTTDCSLMGPKDILAHSILGQSARRHGAGGLEIVGARVTDSDGRDTMQIEMLGSLTFHLLLRANEEVVEPSAGIHLFDRLGNVVFASGTRQLGKRLPDLSSGEELVVSLKLQLNVQAGEYTFSLGTSQASGEKNPNIGILEDRHEMLGPIVVVADWAKLLPFYGIAQLPLEVAWSCPER